MTERCPGCGVPSQVCARAECEVARLRAQAQRGQATIAAARKCIEAADSMRSELSNHTRSMMGATNTVAVEAIGDFDAARAEFAKAEAQTNGHP